MHFHDRDISFGDPCLLPMLWLGVVHRSCLGLHPERLDLLLWFCLLAFQHLPFIFNLPNLCICCLYNACLMRENLLEATEKQSGLPGL